MSASGPYLDAAQGALQLGGLLFPHQDLFFGKALDGAVFLHGLEFFQFGDGAVMVWKLVSMPPSHGG